MRPRIFVLKDPVSSEFWSPGNRGPVRALPLTSESRFSDTHAAPESVAPDLSSTHTGVSVVGWRGRAGGVQAAGLGRVRGAPPPATVGQHGSDEVYTDSEPRLVPADEPEGLEEEEEHSSGQVRSLLAPSTPPPPDPVPQKRYSSAAGVASCVLTAQGAVLDHASKRGASLLRRGAPRAQRALPCRSLL